MDSQSLRAECPIASIHPRQEDVSITSRLPPELLLHIIQFCINDTPLFPQANRKSAERSLDLVVNPPWCTRMSPDNHLEGRTERSKQDVDRWTTQQERASNLPLQVTLMLQGVHPHPVLDDIFQLCSRWSKVRIAIYQPRLSKQLESDPGLNAFSNLTYLHLTFVPSIWDQEATWPDGKYQTFGQALGLRTLAITMEVAERLDSPWHVLEHLRITGVDKPHPTREVFLALSAKLRKLVFGTAMARNERGLSSEGIAFRWNPPIVISQLRELTLEGLAGRSDILTSIFTPSLQRLRCISDVGQPTSSFRAFTSMMAAASWTTQLTHLDIGELHISPLRPLSVFGDVLSETSALVDLRLLFDQTPRLYGETVSADVILDLLCVQQDQHVVCPWLERLDLRGIMVTLRTFLYFLSDRLTMSPVLSPTGYHMPCLQRLAIYIPYGCLAKDEYAWSSYHRHELGELVDRLQEYDIRVPHKLGEDVYFRNGDMEIQHDL